MVVYFLQISTTEGQPVTCSIRDNTTLDVEEIIPINLTGSGTPLVLSVIDNSEDKFTVIKALQLEINFLSTNTVNMGTFAEGDDNRYYVEVTYGVEQLKIFKGHLVLDDLSEPFICHPNEVNLKATDGLGLLKDIPLTDFDNENPKGTFSIIQYITWALVKTGMELNINALFNLRNKTAEHAFLHTYLDAKTFEDEIGTSLDCYRVLEMILGENCYLTQVFGEWWIVRVHEHMNDSNLVVKFDHEGNVIATNDQAWTYVCNGDALAFFSQDDTGVKYVRPYKSIKETFNYEYPKEIIDNMDFKRGQLLSPLFLTVNETDFRGEGIDINNPPPGFDAARYTASGFLVEDWALNDDLLSPDTNGTTTAHIKRVFFDNYEKSRYAVIKQNATGNNVLRANTFIVGPMDKLNISVDRRLTINSNAGGTTQDVGALAVKLNGDDGLIYWLNKEGQWRQLPSFQVDVIPAIWKEQEVDERDWMNISVDSRPAPVGGKVTVYLGQSSIFYDQADTHYNNLQVTYTPYINGGYADHSGQYFKIEQGGNYKAIGKQEVSISDSPRRLFKGALLRYDGTNYILTDGWADFAENPAPAPNDYKPFGHWQAYGIWNQFNRTFRQFEFTIQGIGSNDPFPTMAHRYIIQENHIHTRFKIFMLLHFELDLRSCEWTGVMVEVKDVNMPKDYTTPAEFRYTEDR